MFLSIYIFITYPHIIQHHTSKINIENIQVLHNKHECGGGPGGQIVMS